MVPTNDTDPAVKMLTLNKERNLNLPTLTPKLLALSSPNRRAVNFQAEAREKGTIATMRINKKRIFSQLALVSDPKLQKINCCSASALAMYCKMPVKALKVKTRAIPKSTRPSGPAPLREERVCNNMVAPKANRKALAKTIHSVPTPGRLTPIMIASAAPNEAAADTPKVKGLAIALFMMVCISHPAIESEAPTSKAMME